MSGQAKRAGSLVGSVLVAVYLQAACGSSKRDFANKAVAGSSGEAPVADGGRASGGGPAQGAGGSAGEHLGDAGDAGTTGTTATAGAAGAVATECVPGNERSCAEAGLRGSCAAGTQSCGMDAHWGNCTVLPAPQDTCATGNDDSCNGVPNEGCECAPGAERPCTGVLGNCASGKQTCVAGSWGACSVLPKAADACSPGDDANCNGKPNEGCTCTEGTTEACGPAAVGICKPGKSTCTGGSWGTCVGAVLPGARLCSSASDNNCDGKADNLLDSVCVCSPTDSRSCNSHAGDGKGICHAGTQTCTAASNGASSFWGDCIGAVGPLPADRCDVKGDDSNCDGTKNGGCTCVSGDATTCGQLYSSKGVCSAIALSCSSAGKWPAQTACAATSAEVCAADGKDENCNGQVNENCCPALQCGVTCCPSAPPNTTPGCSGQSCASPCTTPLSCSSSGGQHCGSWNFSSSDPGFEGWTVDSSHADSLASALYYSQGRLAAPMNLNQPATLYLTTTLCSAGVTTNVKGKTLHFELSISPAVSSLNAMHVYPNLLNPGGSNQVAADRDLTSSLSWDIPALPDFDAQTLEFEISSPNAYNGTLYLDNVSIK